MMFMASSEPGGKLRSSGSDGFSSAVREEIFSQGEYWFQGEEKKLE